MDQNWHRAWNFRKSAHFSFGYSVGNFGLPDARNSVKPKHIVNRSQRESHWSGTSWYFCVLGPDRNSWSGEKGFIKRKFSLGFINLWSDSCAEGSINQLSSVIGKNLNINWRSKLTKGITLSV